MKKISIPVFKLKFKEALHISDVRLDYGTTEKLYHSDALSAALIAVNARWGKQIPPNGQLPCTVSSLFPFWEQSPEDTTYYLPKPLIRLKNTDSGIAKKLKKLQWVDAHFFQLISNNSDLGEIEALINGAYLNRGRMAENIMYLQTIPRVQVPRNEIDTTQIFYMQMMRFSENAGLYFMASGETEGLRWLKESLRMLGLEGMGTDRNVGNGHFTYEESKLELELPETGNAMTNLSLFCPESYDQLQAMLHHQGSTDLIKRGGWVTSDEALGIRKQPIYFFKEGSIFKNMAQQEDMPYTFGQSTIDLTPSTLPNGRSLSHKIFRHGRSLFLPINLV
jgi:CRISPR-associated protein Csm4